MRARTWVDARTRFNPFKRLIAWLLIGISASQLGLLISFLHYIAIIYYYNLLLLLLFSNYY